MEKNETGFQTAPEAPTLCINNCGFFGTPATMNMCSKCHKDIILKQENAKLATSSISNIINGGPHVPPPVSSGYGMALSTQPSSAPQTLAETSERVKQGHGLGQGPARCTTCRKRVGLTGFDCRCGNVFCSVHRYSDKHDCEFDYRASGKDAIAKANPVVKGEKLDKI